MGAVALAVVLENDGEVASPGDQEASRNSRRTVPTV
jgi:hypothetical protein